MCNVDDLISMFLLDLHIVTHDLTVVWCSVDEQQTPKIELWPKSITNSSKSKVCVLKVIIDPPKPSQPFCRLQILRVQYNEAARFVTVRGVKNRIYFCGNRLIAELSETCGLIWAPRYVGDSSKSPFGVVLLQVESTQMSHVGQVVQFPPHRGCLFPVCGGLHQWIHQHFRVSLFLNAFFSSTSTSPPHGSRWAGLYYPLCRKRIYKTAQAAKYTQFSHVMICMIAAIELMEEYNWWI